MALRRAREVALGRDARLALNDGSRVPGAQRGGERVGWLQVSDGRRHVGSYPDEALADLNSWARARRRLTRARERAGLSLRRLTAAAGLSPSELLAIEAGDDVPPGAAERLAAVLGVPVALVVSRGEG